MVGALDTAVGPRARPALVVVPPLLDARLLGPVELVEHQLGRVARRRALVGERVALDGDPSGNPAPPPLTSRATARILLDEPVLLQLPEVIARRSARLVEPGGELRRRRRSVQAELVAQLHPQRVGETLQGAGVENPVGESARPTCAQRWVRSTRSAARSASARGPAVRAGRPGAAGARRQRGERRSLRPIISRCSSVASSEPKYVFMSATLQLQRTLCKDFFAIVSLQSVTPAAPACGR